MDVEDARRGGTWTPGVVVPLPAAGSSLRDGALHPFQSGGGDLAVMVAGSVAGLLLVGVGVYLGYRAVGGPGNGESLSETGQEADGHDETDEPTPGSGSSGSQDRGNSRDGRPDDGPTQPTAAPFGADDSTSGTSKADASETARGSARSATPEHADGDAAGTERDDGTETEDGLAEWAAAESDDEGTTSGSSAGEPDRGHTAAGASANESESETETAGNEREAADLDDRETIYCPQCGEELVADANFCRSCGTGL